MLRLTYNGKLSREKGFGRFLDVVRMLAERRPALVIRVKVIGWYADEREKKILEKKQADMPGRVRITHHPFLEYHEFLQMIRDVDLFFDLRRGDPENQRCLPIRIFLYAALGRPVIFTNLKALRREVETARFGRLVNPRDTAAVVRLVEEYLDDRQLYLAHCREARRLAEERYNWSAVSGHFITFLEKTTVS
jgi:glycosyltransferase involved in cell wall biosynthesis